MKVYLVILFCIIFVNINAQVPCGKSIVLTSTADNYKIYGRNINADSLILATNNIYGAANVVYKSNNSINLKPGFSVDTSEGATFSASIPVNCFQTELTQLLDNYPQDSVYKYSIEEGGAIYRSNILVVKYDDSIPNEKFEIEDSIARQLVSNLMGHQILRLKKCKCDERIVLWKGDGLDEIPIDVIVAQGGSLMSQTSRISGASRDYYLYGNLHYDNNLNTNDSLNNMDLYNINNTWNFHQNTTSVLAAFIDDGFAYDNIYFDKSSNPNMNFWKNPLELYIDNIDNDLNGFKDDIIGWDFVNDNNNPIGNSLHGSDVLSFTTSKYQVPNVVEKISIMMLRVLDSHGVGELFNVLCATKYAQKNNAEIINCSFGFYALPENLSLYNTIISELENDSILVVAAAGNGLDKKAVDLELTPFFPACFSNNHQNVFSVTSSYNNQMSTEVCNQMNFSSKYVDISVGITNCKVTPPFLSLPTVGTSYATPTVTALLSKELYNIKIGSSVRVRNKSSLFNPFNLLNNLIQIPMNPMTNYDKQVRNRFFTY